jgi:uncharacterized cupredoxin-like copper-binding protein
MASGVAGGLAQGNMAQDDGTGADIPTGPLACVIVRADTLPVTTDEAANGATPVVDTATPMVSEPATPVASPVVDEATPVVVAASPAASPLVDTATPVIDGATPMASPVAETAPAGPDAQVMEDVTGVVTALVSCLNERDFETYAALTSDLWRGAMFGIDEPLEADLFVDLAEVQEATETRLLDVSNLQVVDESTVTVDVTYVNASQLRTSRWTLSHERVQGLPTWVLQSGEGLPVQAPEGASVIDVAFGDASYTVDPATASSTDVVLNLSNPTGTVHEALVLRLDEGMTTDAVLQSTGGVLPEGVALIGQATVAPGGHGQLVLVDLQPGTFTIVDLLPGENGLPHLSAGMEATFTVEP